jgi:hypothetical protein
MFNEIWESIKEIFTLIYNRIKKYLIKPAYITLSLFSLYCFINYLIHYEILLAFGNLFAAIVFLKLLEGSE